MSAPGLNVHGTLRRAPTRGAGDGLRMAIRGLDSKSMAGSKDELT